MASRLPGYCHHKPTGRAYVRLAGRMIYLGEHGSPESKQAYARILAEWTSDRRLPTTPRPSSDHTVEEVIADYWSHAQAKYQDVRTTDRIRRSLAVVRALYGSLPVGEFRGKALRACRQSMIDTGRLCRRSVNQRVAEIKRCWKWALSEELVPAEAAQSVLALTGLRRCEAPEGRDVRPVSLETVEATLPHLPGVVAEMVRVQLACGCRPGEVCAMRSEEIDRLSDDLWIWRPAAHKTAHRGHVRQVFLGPKAIEVIRPLVEEKGYLFSPKRAIAELRAKQRAARKTPVQPSQVDRSKERPAKQPGDRYPVHSYHHAIARACKLAGVPHWHPHQLRHTAATIAARQFGWESARIFLGHRSLDVTRIYAEDDVDRAAEVARKIG